MAAGHQLSPYWPTLAKQILLDISYLLLALSMAIRGGPTLLDLEEVYETDTKSISYGLIAMSIGGVIGSLLCAVLVPRCKRHLFLFMAVVILNFAAGTAMTPHCGSLPVYYAVMVYTGIFLIAIHSSKIFIVASDSFYL